MTTEAFSRPIGALPLPAANNLPRDFLILGAEKIQPHFFKLEANQSTHPLFFEFVVFTQYGTYHHHHPPLI